MMSQFDLQHEAVKIEMASKQHELDQFSCKGKQLVSELKKIPDCDADAIKKDTDGLVDQWLDVSGTRVDAALGSTPVDRTGGNINSDLVMQSFCQVSERIDENINLLNQSLMLWEDVRRISEDIESWTSSSMIELNEILNHLNDSQKVSERLSGSQVRFMIP